jgi:phage gp29-like protein
MSIPFQMFFIDRLVADLENEREIQSQMLSVAQDIIAQLRYPGFEFTVGNSSDITFITDTTPDLLAGVTARVLIDIPYAADRCQVPSDFIF